MSMSPHQAVSRGSRRRTKRNRPRAGRRSGSSDAGLAEVVPAGPGEVADDVAVGLDELPVADDRRRPGLGADDDPVGEEVPVEFVAGFGVVHAGDVEHGVGLFGALGRGLRGLDVAHHLAEAGHHRVDAALWRCGCGLPTRLHLRDDRVEHRDEPVDAVGDVAGAVERADLLGELASPGRADRVPVSGISLPIE